MTEKEREKKTLYKQEWLKDRKQVRVEVQAPKNMVTPLTDWEKEKENQSGASTLKKKHVLNIVSLLLMSMHG